MDTNPMQAKTIDSLNIGLILLSLILAIKLPFELFLFSYAFLGPLHYLTEINWLKSKSFFIRKQNGILILLLLTFLISIPILLKLPMLADFTGSFWPAECSKTLTDQTNLMILTALLFAIGIIHFDKWVAILLFLAGSLAASILILKFIPVSNVLVGLFIPTLIHIYVFTLLFMIFGAINHRTTPGILAILLLMLCPVIVFNLQIDTAAYPLSESTKANFSSSNLDGLNVQIANFFGQLENGHFNLISPVGIKIQIFLAFCYTYHYLNWFSKTSIIGWNKAISKPGFYLILVLWLASVGLYCYDYKTGLMALFFLSFLHVILEFPLNMMSIRGIYRKIAG